MMWDAFRRQVEEHGGEVRLNCAVVGIERDGDRILGVRVEQDGQQEFIEADDVISSMPVTEFIKKLSPPPPAAIVQAAGQLKYRDFLTVCLIVDRAELFDDNWIYIHEPVRGQGRTHPELQELVPR